MLLVSLNKDLYDNTCILNVLQYILYNVPIHRHNVPFYQHCYVVVPPTCVHFKVPAHHKVTSVHVYEFVHVATCYTVYSWQTIAAPYVCVRCVLWVSFSCWYLWCYCVLACRVPLASSPGPSQFFNVTCRKTGGPGTRCHVRHV